jgi:two-component system cell cycle response regulator
VRLADGSRIQLGSSLLLKYLRLDPCDEGFQREMFERSVRDNLTGLFNRAYFSNQIVPLAERNEQLQLGLAIILIDLDHFKRINDTYGHNGGDLVLREVAAVLRDSTRAEDLVARYGGEEFVIALPSTTLEQAIERAERIRTQIAERGIDEGSIGDIRVTASLGLSFSPAGHARNIPGLISAADSALYDAKKLGRNRVSCARAGIRGTAAKTESADSLVIL